MDFRTWFVVPVGDGAKFLVKDTDRAAALASFLFKRPEPNVGPVLTWQEYADERGLHRPATELQYQIGMRRADTIPYGMIILMTE